MSDADPAEFVDTNILVYAFDETAGAKRSAGTRLLTRLAHSGRGCVSMQVLQEFFVTITWKVSKPLPLDEAAERVRELSTWRVFSPTRSDLLAAIALQQQTRLNFWDAMIVHAAAELACAVLWTEDLNPGQQLRGVRIRNPFVEQS